MVEDDVSGPDGPGQESGDEWAGDGADDEVDAYEIGLDLLHLDGLTDGMAVLAREMARVDAVVAAGAAGAMGLAQPPSGTAVPVREERVLSAASAGVATLPEPAEIGRDGAVRAPMTAGAAEPGITPGRLEPARTDSGVQRSDARATGRRTRRGAAVPTMAAVAMGREVTHAALASAPETLPEDRRVIEPGGGQSAAPAKVERRPAMRGRGAAAGSRQGGRAASGGGMGQAAAPAGIEELPVLIVVSQIDAVRDEAAEAGFAPSSGWEAAPRVGPQESKAEAPVPATAPWPVQGRAAPRRPAARVPGGTEASGQVGYDEMVAAPASSGRPEREGDGGEGRMGDVFLDGHLVGQWLGERMAREAARPGAGTTFFDARQSPAWTPSGVA